MATAVSGPPGGVSGATGVEARARAWWRVLMPSSWPTTADGVHAMLMSFAIASRVGLLIVAALPMLRNTATSPNQALCWVMTLTCLAASAGWIRDAIRRQALPGPLWRGCDTTAAAIALVTSPLWVVPQHLHSSWVGWPEFVALNACCVSAGAAKRLRDATWIGVGWAALWCVSVPPHLVDAEWQDLAGTALNFVMFAVLLGVTAAFILRVAADADAARRAAAASAAEAERHRARVLVHDSANMLSLLAESSTSDVVVHHARAQAKDTMQRMRTFLADESSTRPVGSASSIEHVTRAAVRGFDDLPVEILVDLADDITLASDQASALESAMRAALQNVRLHAFATEVVIHADACGERWELTVHDDGVGFEVADARQGFGLRHQVNEGSRRVGLGVSVASELGVGTTITFSNGSVSDPVPDGSAP